MKLLLLTVLAAMISQAEFATVDNIKVYYEATGKGTPAVVLIHGWTCDSSFWRFQQPALAKNFRVVAVDLPGHGKSGKPEVDYTAALLARGVIEVMKAAKVERAVVVGHSMGAVVARKMLDLEPERVAAFVSVEGAIFRPESSDFLTKVKEWALTMRGPNGAAVRRQFIESMYRPSTTAKLREEITRKMLSTPEHVAVSAMTNGVGTDVWSGSKVSVPALAINKKSVDDQIEKNHRAVFEQIDYREIEGASHFLHMERPEQVNQMLIEFVNKAGR